MKKYSKVVLVSNQHESLHHRGSYVPIGTVGEVIATRYLDGDPERMYLVKFAGVGSYRSVHASWIKEVTS